MKKNDKNKQLKIVHALAYYGTYNGGIQLYVKQLAEHQVKRGNKVKIVTSKGYGSQKKINGVDVVKTRTLFSAYRVPFTPFLPFILLREDCDILHAHLPLPWLDLAIALKKIIHPKTKLIITIHNYLPANSKISKAFSWIHNTFLIRAALSKADIVITTTKEFPRSLPYKIPKKNHVVIPLGVDTKLFQPSKNYKFDQNKLLFVGRLIPEKGLHILMEAMQEVIKKNKNVKLQVVCADTYNYRNYEKRIKKLDKGFLTITKGIPHNQISKYYASANALILPSIDLDSFGYVLLEAMSSGCPVITTDLPGPKSIAKDAGVIVPRGSSNKLAQAIMSSLKSRQNIRKRVRKLTEEKYSLSLMYKKIDNLYA